ncbi:MAG: hypothetical protein AAF585_20495 [Verrucomicrobiota bacterium]
MNSVIKWFLPVSIAFALSSCYEDHSEVWLNEDGSGKVKNTIVFKGKAIALVAGQGMDLNSLGAQQFIDNQDGIRLLSASTKQEAPDAANIDALSEEEKEALFENARLVHELEYEFEDLKSLHSLKIFDTEEGKNSASGILMRIEEAEDGTLKWRSEIEGPTSSGFDSSDSFKGAKASMKVHFPRQIIESNADVISTDGLTATWNIEADKIINSTAQLSATLSSANYSYYAFEFNWKTILGIVGGILVLILVFLLGRGSKKA